MVPGRKPARLRSICRVRVAARAPLVTLKIIVTGELKDYWNIPQQQHRWHEVDFETAFPELALAGIGEYLDEEPVPQQPDESSHAAVVLLQSDLLELFAREPEQDDARLLRFIGGKLFWGYRYGLDAVLLRRHDALRFGVSEQDLHHVARQSEGVLWKRGGDGAYRAEPRLMTEFRSGTLPGQERLPIEQIAELIDKNRYPTSAHHIEKARSYLHGENVDLPSAAKEAIAAVESVCKTLLNEPTGTLGDCVKALRAKQLGPREIARMLESLYVYRSATPGVAHGGVTLPAVSEAEAQLMIGRGGSGYRLS